MTEKLLSISEAAKLLGVCENTLRDWDIEGKFKAVRTSGGHRRYSIDQIREYLEKNPPEEEKRKYIFSNPTIEKMMDKWSSHLSGVNPDEMRTLSILLDNTEAMHKCHDNPVLSTAQAVWLTKEGWLRSKFRKMVRVQPMTGPASLVHYTRRRNDGGLVVESEGIAARTRKYSFPLFVKAEFEKLKEVYADALAEDIDHTILELLPKIDVENLLDVTYLNNVNLKDLYDYIIAPPMVTEPLLNRKCTEGVDIFEGPTFLDPESFKPFGVGGCYPTDKLTPPIFAPYILFVEAVTQGPVRSILMRVGSYTGTHLEIKEVACPPQRLD